MTPMPGTTRDIVRATIQLNGVAVDLLDTAGLQESDDPVEQLGCSVPALQRSRRTSLLIEDCAGRAELDLLFLPTFPPCWYETKPIF